ncbi:XrtA-associated tyrosine autokinase [Trichlorobacter ammonificans]|uniref:Polysaccharide biosynthesis protein n=1 Tax=Trichlorobacter ammonificans TaxID=2916410 RepID=A0ABM9D818_9BACT|nr:XrtA-associated tyrosine autokinase [Trichlorobacter ammonificans]CAH2031361.1 Polysaccharide biosynthesis protein [Trichlorobacter ammonificans]
MSRIEEALEKAARLRVEVTSDVSAPRAPRVHVPPLPESRLELTNQLLVTANDPHTQAAEEYRKLKSVIVHLTKTEAFLNMLMVTSSVSNEGKSITAANLALSLAQEFDHTVLLVDADIRKPNLHTYLGVENRVGLADCLLDNVDVKDALVHTGIGKLSFLSAGRSMPNPVEMFTSQRIRDFFLEMKNRYNDRYIIIDTPPVLPFAETRSLSTIVDGIILVAKEGLVTLHNLEETMECLKGSTMLGVVYNEAATEMPVDRYRYVREASA